MHRLRSTLILSVALGLSPLAAQADGGDREQAGGAFMSSYSRRPDATAAPPALQPSTSGDVTTGSVRGTRTRPRVRRPAARS